MADFFEYSKTPKMKRFNFFCLSIRNILFGILLFKAFIRNCLAFGPKDVFFHTNAKIYFVFLFVCLFVFVVAVCLFLL